VSQEKYQNFKRQKKKYFKHSVVATESISSIFGGHRVFD
jgi:hypothetical protein